MSLQWPFRWQQLAMMIGAGLAIDHALRTIAKQADKKTNSGSTLKRIIGLVERCDDCLGAVQPIITLIIKR